MLPSSPHTSVSLNVFVPAAAAMLAGQVLATPLSAVATPRVTTASKNDPQLLDPPAVAALHLALANVMSIMHQTDNTRNDGEDTRLGSHNDGEDVDTRLGSRLARELSSKVLLSRYQPLQVMVA